MRSTILHGLTLITFLIGLWCIGDHLSQAEAARRAKPTASSIYKLDAKLLNLFTLGHKRLLEYIGIINAIQFFADRETLSKVAFEDLNSGVIQSVLALKPRMESFYRFSCVMAINFRRPEACEAISQAGLELLPSAWRLAVTQGYVEKFLLKNDTKAAVYYQLASTKTGAPAYLKLLALRLAKKDPFVYNDPAFIQSLSELPDGDKLIEAIQNSLKSPPQNEVKP